MHALIVGCGYLGSRVAASLLAAGHRVSVTTRSEAKATAFRAQGFEPIVCDVTVEQSLKSIPRVDALVSAVALDRTTGQSMRDVYEEGLALLAGTIPDPGRWIHVSSTSVYGQTDESWVDEDSPTIPEEPAGKVMLATEAAVRNLQNAICLRFSGIYGPGRLLRRKSIEAGETIVGDDAKWLNLIHVEDGTRTVIAAIERGVAGRVYNVCDDEPVRRRDFYTEMASVLNAPPPRFERPPPDAPTPPHERGNRRIRNRRMREELHVELAYPNYRTGLRSSVER